MILIAAAIPGIHWAPKSHCLHLLESFALMGPSWKALPPLQLDQHSRFCLDVALFVTFLQSAKVNPASRYSPIPTCHPQLLTLFIYGPTSLPELERCPGAPCFITDI